MSNVASWLPAVVVDVDVRIPEVATHAIAHKAQTQGAYVSIMESFVKRPIGIRNRAHGLSHHRHRKTNRASPRGDGGFR